jgi:hypothetical protein
MSYIYDARKCRFVGDHDLEAQGGSRYSILASLCRCISMHVMLFVTSSNLVREESRAYGTVRHTCPRESMRSKHLNIPKIQYDYDVVPNTTMCRRYSSAQTIQLRGVRSDVAKPSPYSALIPKRRMSRLC